MNIRSLTGLTGAVFCCALIFSCQNGDSSTKADDLRLYLPAQQRVAGEYLVTPAENVSQDQFTQAIQKALAMYDVQILEVLSSSGIIRVRLAKDPGPEAVASIVKSVPEIKAIQPNFIYKAFDSRPGALK